jgi:hypothetical protein
MKIELLCGVFETVTAAIKDDPKHGHNDCGQQQNARDDDDEDVLAP